MLERGPRGSVLTSEGAILLECYRRVSLETHLALQSISHQVKSERFTIRIGSAPSYGLRILPQAINQFRTRFPDTRFEISHASPRTLFSDLEAGEIEIYVGPLPKHESSEAFISNPIAEVPSRVFARKDHPLGTHTEVTYADLLQFPWVSLPNLSDLTLPGNWYDKLHRFAYETGQRPPLVDMETTSVVGALSLIRENDHLVCLSSLVTEEAEVRGLMPLALQEQLTEHLSGVAYRSTIGRHPRYGTFIDTLSKTIERSIASGH